MQKNTVQPEGPHDNIIRRMRSACWITKATDTNMICITAFLRQQRLRERALILPSVWGARVVSISFPESVFCLLCHCVSVNINCV